MSKRWKPEEESFLIEHCKSMTRSELASHFCVTVKSISDKLRRLNKRCEDTNVDISLKKYDDLIEQFGDVRKHFILDFIRFIDYNDLARLAGIKSSELKEAVEKMGIKLPLERARAWSEIDVGKYRSISDCARCQVQTNHGSFYVNMNNCRKCLEKNIRFWIYSNVKIMLIFREMG